MSAGSPSQERPGEGLGDDGSEEGLYASIASSIGAIAVHCFFVAAITGCCYATFGAFGGLGDDGAVADYAGTVSPSPDSGLLGVQQDVRSIITFALGGLMTFFAQSGDNGVMGRQAIKRLNVVASLL